LHARAKARETRHIRGAFNLDALLTALLERLGDLLFSDARRLGGVALRPFLRSRKDRRTFVVAFHRQSHLPSRHRTDRERLPDPRSSRSDPRSNPSNHALVAPR
jgi:hypothetical protein